MRRSERLANLLLGLNLLVWAGLGAAAMRTDPGHAVPRGAAVAVNALVGLLFLLRAPVRRHAGMREFLWAAPSLVASGFLFKVAVEHGEWGLLADSVLLLGTGVAVAGMLSLGRSFAILPAARPLASGGLYRWVRHPVYLGEFVMGVACLIAAPGWGSGAALAVLLPFMVVRIRIEESFLRRHGDYQAYAAEVRHRLVPGIW